jgi:ferredoxin
MGTGPEVNGGYDIAMTEVIEKTAHYFIVSIGSAKGRSLCDQLSLPSATQKECDKALSLIQNNKEQMLRHVDADHVHDMLMNSWNCKRWDQVAERCINCANCTMVCPTCFCSEIKDSVSLDNKNAERWQNWDSCFNLSHSYIHGGCIRQSAQSRYRQWLTHKFGTWWDQFGMSGCVGCGRCITWCPVGIDVTEELHELKIECDETNR